MSEADAKRLAVLDVVRDCIGRGEPVVDGYGQGARTDGAPGDEFVLTIKVRCAPGAHWLEQGCAA